MAKMYTNQKTKMSVVSGKILSIGDNRQSLTVKTQVYNKDTTSYDDKEIEFATTLPIEEEAKVGDNVTVVGYEQVNMMEETSQWIAGYVSTKNNSFQYKTLAVVNGEVVYARYNEELDENGNPNMTKERLGPNGATIPSKAKSPHFDIGVSTMNDEGKRVLHTIKAYPDPVKDKEGNVIEGKKNFDKIDSLKKRFANFDKNDNPMRVTIATQPGQISTSTREYNGTTYENTYSNHMGIYSLDIEYLKERTREQAPATKEESAPTPTEPVAPVAPENEFVPVPEEENIDDLFDIK